ncbi:MAG: branched-chain amino acid ABC transporter permease [Bacillati bacterium ANGP1]|uniref:Branched-chain amino acid ABC transporter permease n=1 Tax=Candidatus Segetimicrobium genomatis TaxID=2569760 RepID=A0A537M8E4_9BACT|nr:MAG: branched-chain amino acid ABC transporter permease [Terrabacteria group bacterium ANGP1]
MIYKIGWAVLLAAGLLLPMPVYPVLAVDILAWALFATAFDIMLGYTGLLSFGQAAFFGGGAYTAGLLAQRLGVPYPLNALAAALAAGLLALPIMGLAIRRRGIYFAMITLAFGQMVFYVVNEWRSLTGGENGIQGIPRVALGGLDISSSTTYYYAAFPLAVLGLLLCWRIVRSPFGRVLLAIRENDVRTETLGYAVHRYKLLAAVLSCALSGLAGGIWVINHGFVALDAVHWTTSGLVVIMVLLGGMGTRLGPLVGAALVLLLRDFISTWTDAWGVVTGTIFILVILIFRQGIVGTIERLLEARTRPAPAPAPAVEEVASPHRS